MLNQNQRKAVFAKDRFIFLLAGAGTGKTRVIVERVKRMLKEGLDPAKMLIISFTKKSVGDLKWRLNERKDLLITTFHGFCYKMLKEERELNIVEEEKLIEKGFNKDQLNLIEITKRANKKTKLTIKYQKFLQENKWLDFSDLEILLNKRLATDKRFKQTLKANYKYIFIDEFQDTSMVQFLMLKHFKSNTNQIFCVGDPNQSIYAFRGASEKVINDYIKYFKAKIYYLDLNYRSGENIVRAANNVIRYNKSGFKQKLFTRLKEKGIVVVKYFVNEERQTDFIYSEIYQLLTAGFKQEKIAILYRNHYFANKIKARIFQGYYQRINCLTIHQAKGLEFDIVFLINLQEGDLPHYQSELSEERRLFYVAITRAKKRLYLLAKTDMKKPSRFIRECFV